MTKNVPRVGSGQFGLLPDKLKLLLQLLGYLIPSESLKPTARFFRSSTVYITLTPGSGTCRYLEYGSRSKF